MDLILSSRFPDVEVPSDKSLSDFLLDKARDHQERVAIVDGLTNKSYTYGELTDSVYRLANGLHKRGVSKGDVVGILMHNSVEYAISLLAVPSLGAIVAGINPYFTVGEMLPLIQRTRPSYLITSPELLPKLHQVQLEYKHLLEVYVTGPANKYLTFNEILESGDSHRRDVDLNALKDPCLYLATSGTTSLPKIIQLSHYNVCLESQLIGLSPDAFYAQDDVVVILWPFYHIGGSVCTLFAGLAVGISLIIVPESNPETDFDMLLNIIKKYKVTNMILSPTLAVKFTKSPLVTDEVLSSVNRVMVGGAPSSAKTLQDLKNKFQLLNVRQGYGTSELAGVSHTTPNMDTNLATVGKLFPNVQFKIVNSEGRALGPNEEGLVYLRGPMLMLGYLVDEGATFTAVDEEGWYNTGDIGYYDEEEYLYIVDRDTDMIKFHTFPVSPAEVEGVLQTHPSVYDAIVIGVPDEEAVQLAKAFVQLRPGKSATADELVVFTNERLARYKWLRAGVEFVDKIPATASGKKLRRLYRDKK